MKHMSFGSLEEESTKFDMEVAKACDFFGLDMPINYYTLTTPNSNVIPLKDLKRFYKDAKKEKSLEL